MKHPISFGISQEKLLLIFCYSKKLNFKDTIFDDIIHQSYEVLESKIGVIFHPMDQMR
jgi:hypothetical protein